MLKERIITAVILMPLVIIGVFYLPPIIFDLLVLLIALLAAWEFSSLFNWSYQKRVRFLVSLGLVMLFIELLYIPHQNPSNYSELTLVISSMIFGQLLGYVFLSGVLWWLFAPYILWHYVKTGINYSLRSPMFLGMVIFIPCWISLTTLRLLDGGALLFCLLLAIVWAADIGAYFVGRFFGKHHLLPKISPKKTVEGVIGGVLASLLITGAFVCLMPGLGLMLFKTNQIILLLILSIVVSLWSVIGDLFESMLKRHADVKDSGKILPGHGGIYDRIDSLTAAAPIFVVGLWMIELLT